MSEPILHDDDEKTLTRVDTGGEPTSSRTAAEHTPVSRTPGPWWVHCGTRITYVNAGPSTRRDEVCVCYGPYDVEDKFGIQIANARLIAAAPELLAALRALARGVPEYPCFCKVATGKATAHTHRCVAAVAAIAKAEGR